MTARVAYMIRGDRGVLLRAVRLAGAREDQTWESPAQDAANAGPGEIALAAGWLRDRLGKSRAGMTLAALCLDAEGAAFTWVSSPTRDRRVVAAVAREVPETGGTHIADAVEFFAPEDGGTFVQPLVAQEADGPSRSILPGLNRAKAQPQASFIERLAVLAATDSPARLLIDELDALGVGVEGVISVWHVLARTWDPSAGAHETGDAPISAPTTAVLVADPRQSRLLWAWGQAGTLLAGGSLRVGRVGGEEQPWTIGTDQAARLATDWLAWAAQLGRAPSRIICVLPEAHEESSARFARALGAAWSDASVDVVTHDDPMGATLRRYAEILEGTPAPTSTDTSPAHGLSDLTLRRGREHRRMYVWTAAALCVAAGMITLIGVGLRRQGERALTEAAQWDVAWRDRVKTTLPDLILQRPGVSPLTLLRTELENRERRMRRPEKAEPAMPILSELETLSFVIGNPDYTLEAIDLDTKGINRLRVVTSDIGAAEDLLKALRDIAGSHIGLWREQFTDKPDKDGTRRVLASFNGSWGRPADGGGQ